MRTSYIKAGQQSELLPQPPLQAAPGKTRHGAGARASPASEPRADTKAGLLQSLASAGRAYLNPTPHLP